VSLVEFAFGFVNRTTTQNELNVVDLNYDVQLYGACVNRSEEASLKGLILCLTIYARLLN